MSAWQYRPTEITVSLGTLQDNASALKRRLNGKARMMAVIKADAYGHGAVEAAKTAVNAGADALAVALVEEAVELRDAYIRAPILVLGGVTQEGARAAVEEHVALAVFDAATLLAMQKRAEELDTVAHAHIKIDTGMGRVGVRGGAALGKLLEAMADCSRVKCEGVFTHFADPDDQEYTRWQNAQFNEAVAQVRRAGFRPIAHAAASAAMLMDETLWHDMVRPGIALYGSAVRHLCPELLPAQRLSTKPVRLTWIEPGDFVSYGRLFCAARKTRVMTLPIGYGDGYPRQLSDRASVLVEGRRAPVIGRVCMDMLMCDVTDIPGVTMDTKVVLMGEQGGERITPDELAALTNTIPYEIMLGFSSRIPRRIVP
ncbi:MAG: alanine racemase [Clostridia bacterium]